MIHPDHYLHGHALSLITASCNGGPTPTPPAPATPAPATPAPVTQAPVPAPVPSTRTYYIDIKYDQYPWETSWLLKDTTNGQIISRVGYNTITQTNKLLTRAVQLVPGRQYMMSFRDSEYDGFCCGYGYGYVVVYSFGASGNYREHVYKWGQFGGSMSFYMSLPA